MPDATIHAVGEILENLNPVLYRVALPNGKKILAHLSKPLTEANAGFGTGERVVHQPAHRGGEDPISRRHHS